MEPIIKALIYIEDHLDEELSLSEIASVACVSRYHFHRLFRAYTGETLHKYIRRLRMEKAAGKLRYTKRTVTDIALSAGYETPSAFTKAFRSVMGFSPRLYRNMRGARNSTEAANPMRPEIIEIQDQKIFAVRRIGDFKTVSIQAWKIMRRFMWRNQIDKNSVRCFGILHDDPKTTSGQLRYDACITAPAGIEPDNEVKRSTLKGGRFATFIHMGPYTNLEATYDKIFQIWLPTSGATLGDRPCIREYINPKITDDDSQLLLTKIHVPLDS